MIDILQWRSSIGSWYCQNVKGTSNCTAPGWVEPVWFRDQEVDNLTFFLVFLLLLLILSGDVELNPGPKKDISNVLKMVPNKHILINLLAGMSHMWQEIGLALNVEPNFLHGLSSSFDSNEVKLANVIENWMNTQSSPITWEKVISAIEGPIVGHNKSKADELRHHLETSIVSQNEEPTTFSEHIDMETHSLLPEEQSERNSDLGLEDDEKTSEILSTKRKRSDDTKAGPLTKKPLCDESATSGKVIPLSLPNDYAWNEKTKTCTRKSVNRDSLVINEEAVKILEGITNPISVIAVVGPCRSGKSYLLNQLTPSKESLFELGHLFSSHTMGIWMWDTPFQHTLESGEEVTVILLDTEGVDAVRAGTRGDTQVFTLSVLLSSLLVYNSTQVPKRENLNQMTFIANLAKAIGSRGSERISSFKQIAPSFLWILRDALLEPVNSQGISCTFRDYLLKEVLAVPEDFPADDIQIQASKCLLEFFDSLDAEMIPPPSTDPHVAANIDNPSYREEINPEFFQRIEQVCDKILKECKPKRGVTEGSLMNGKQFTEMLKIYVDALNSEDGIPRIGSAWDQAMKNLYESATSRAKKMYKDAMSVLQFPIEEDEIQKHHKEAYERSMELFKQLTALDGDKDVYQKNLEELAATFATFSNGSCNGGLLFKYCEENKQESEKQCQESLENLRLKLLNPVLENLSPEINFQSIDDILREIKQAYFEEIKGPAQEDEFNRFMENLEEEKKRLMPTLSLMKSYDDQLQSKKEELEQQKSQYEKENMGVKVELQSEKLKHETEMENALKHLEEAKQKIKELSQQKHDVEQAKIALETSLEKQQRIIEELQNRIAVYQINEAQLKKENMEFKNQPQSEKLKHETEMENALKCLEEAGQKIKELSQQKHDVETSLEKEQKIVEKLQNKIAVHQINEAQLKEELSSLQNEITELQNKIQMVKEQFEQVNKIKKNMRMDLDKTKDKNKELQEEVKKLNKKLLMEDETTCQQAKDVIEKMETESLHGAKTNYILHDVYIGGEKMFIIQADSSSLLDWEIYGIRIKLPQGAIPPTETDRITIKALVGGHFNMPKGTELISVVYGVFTSKPLLQPVELEIQHCANLVTQNHTNYLSFASAPLNESNFPYEFQLEKGGKFYQNDQYGSISLSQFSLIAIVKSISCPILKLIGNQSISEETYQNVKSSFNSKPCSQLLDVTKSSLANESVVVIPSEDKPQTLKFDIIETTKLPLSPLTGNTSTFDTTSDSNVEHHPQHTLTHSPTVPDKQSPKINQDHDNIESLDSSSSPDKKYFAQVVYEAQSSHRWLTSFIIAKHLNALFQFIKLSLSPNAKKDVLLSFIFNDSQDVESYIKLIFKERRRNSFNGWRVIPHVLPAIAYKSDVDLFGWQNPPSCPSILITVYANNDPNTEPLLEYPISLTGIKPSGISINLIRCINSDGMTCVSPNEDIPCSEDRDDIFHSKPKKHDLLNLVACISDKWQNIGEALGVPNTVLKSLLQKDLENINKLSSVLECWMDQYTTKVTWNSIISAIEGPIVEKKSVADEIRKHVLIINPSKSNKHKRPLREISLKRKGSRTSMSSSSTQKEFKSRNKGKRKRSTSEESGLEQWEYSPRRTKHHHIYISPDTSSKYGKEPLNKKSYLKKGYRERLSRSPPRGQKHKSK